MSGTQKEKKSQLKSAVYGAFAGVASSTVLQPLEVLKINLILRPNQMVSVKTFGLWKSTKQAISIVYKDEGMLGFFRGIKPAVARTATASTVFFYFLDKFKHGLSKKIDSKNTVDFISSATARTISAVVSNPFTVMKTRAGMVGQEKYTKFWTNFFIIYRAEGFSGFMKGNATMILKNPPFGGIFYIIYNYSNKFLKQFSDSSLVYLASGMIAGMVATVFTQPLEICKMRLQANEKRLGTGKKLTIFKVLKDVYKEDGILGYTRGLFPMMLRKPMVNAATFFFYEVFSEMGEKENK